MSRKTFKFRITYHSKKELEDALKNKIVKGRTVNYSPFIGSSRGIEVGDLIEFDIFYYSDKQTRMPRATTIKQQRHQARWGGPKFTRTTVPTKIKITVKVTHVGRDEHPWRHLKVVTIRVERNATRAKKTKFVLPLFH